VLGEGSGFDTGVYIWRVVMPLFVPSQCLVLSWSRRTRSGTYALGAENALRSAIATAADGLGTEADALVEMAGRDDPASPNRRWHEAIGYVHLLQGNVSGARESLARAATGVADPPWVQEVFDRVRLITRLLDEHGPDRAVVQLDRWGDQTAGALGLRRVPSARRA
jgi:hypothetical protein